MSGRPARAVGVRRPGCAEGGTERPRERTGRPLPHEAVPAPGWAGDGNEQTWTREVRTMLRYVAAGIDGSPESLAAAHWAAREAARRGTGLRLVHAWEWLPHSTPYVPAGMSQRQWAEEILERAS